MVTKFTSRRNCDLSISPYYLLRNYLDKNGYNYLAKSLEIGYLPSLTIPIGENNTRSKRDSNTLLKKGSRCQQPKGSTANILRERQLSRFFYQKLTNLFARTHEEESVIGRVASKPSSFASFNKDLKEEINMNNLRDCVPKEYHAYFDIFSKRQSQRLPKHIFQDYVIELKPTFKPQAPKIYPLSPKKHDELGKFIKEHLSRGTIQRLTSYSIAHFFFIGKKNRKIYPV